MGSVTARISKLGGAQNMLETLDTGHANVSLSNQQAALTATSVPLRDGDALRGRIGARVGSEFVEGDIRVEPSVTGFVYSVLTESGVSGAVNGITGVTGLREQGKVRGEVQASVNFFNLKTGLSGFVRADYRIGGDLVGGGGRVGMRYQW